MRAARRLLWGAAYAAGVVALAVACIADDWDARRRARVESR